MSVDDSVSRFDKRNEDNAQTLSDRYALVSEAISEGIYDWNISSGELHVSGRLNAIVGFGERALTAEDWNRRIHPQDFDGYKAAIIEHIRGISDRMRAEYRLRRPIGDYIWVADNGRCIRQDNGEAVRLIGAIRDITSRKLAETHLKDAQRKAEQASQNLLDAIESISEGIVLFDADDRVVLCNSNYRQYFARAANAEVAAMVEPGAVFWDIIRAAYEAGMLPLIDEKGGIENYIEMRKRIRKGTQEPIEQLLSDGTWLQINEHKTSAGGIASVYTDVTELKKREVEAFSKTEMLESLSSRLSKYLSPQIYSSIFSAPQNVEIAPKRKKLTVFFSDIVGFTALVDALESEQLTELLNQYLTEMSKVAVEHGATVDKFIGDAVVAFFGDPVSRGVERDATACVTMAMEMQSKLGELASKWNDRGIDKEFKLRIGIATGYCTVGNFGSEDRLDYTAIGSPVNLAARLQQHAPAGEILLDNETYHLVRQAIGDARKTEFKPKGFSKSVRAYQIKPSGVGCEDIARLETPGISIRVQKSVLSRSDREEAVRSLESAIEHIRGAGKARP
ncbi:PAS-domain containing protein [Rhizobiales bacterium]|uniref:adenylate/guanylate cyclase domain-containing protein n=1 Tax=Hongsoonwoonella zoysiae TaxID=2821844 RepID=UPI0015616444|nr:adenylate/guanylate cyclase domain-containing protein [Hongsoonwoonella zoysiae]NRG18260.1 PAS-domain containing protein [Hongsoonwoonella zoysiae]